METSKRLVVVMLGLSWVAVLAMSLQLDKSWLLDGRLEGQLLLQVTVPTLYQCLHLCVGRSLCRSINFHGPSSQCRLNLQSLDSGLSLTARADWLYLDRQHLQHEDVAGPCVNHNCLDHEFCLAYDCHTAVCIPEGQPPMMTSPAVATPMAEETTASLSTTPQPTATSEATTPQPTATSEATTPQPTATSEATTPQPTATSEATTPQPTTTSVATTPQPTSISEATTPQPTTTSVATASQPTTTSVATTPQPTSISEVTTPQPATTSVATTPQPTSTPTAPTTQPSTAATTAAFPNVNCGSPPAVPPGMTRSYTGTRYHDTATYTCNSGTIWPDTGFLICNESSLWQGNAGGCSYTTCYDPGLPSSYAGKLNVTPSGITCQRWDQVTPNLHGYLFNFFHRVDGSATAANNYCRAIEDPKPWCYKMVTSILSRWEYCSIPQC